MKGELKIVKAPCSKCDRNAVARLGSLTRLVALAKAEKPVAKVVGTMADYTKAIAALVSQGKWQLPWPDAPPDLNALIRERRDVVAGGATTPRETNGVPNPPDLNEAIRRSRAMNREIMRLKEKK